MNYAGEAPTTTADSLVAVARRLFAQHGYDGTSVRAITAAAGANLGAITYHFGSKRELYDTVVGSVVGPLSARVEGVVGGGGGVLERVAAVVRAYFGYLADNPDMPRLMVQELVLGGVPSRAVAGPMRRVHGALQRLVEEGQAAGQVRAGDASILAIFIMSVPVHLALVQAPMRAVVGLDFEQPALRERAIAHAVSFVCGGLTGEEAG